jgi:hypothetical protein
MSADFRALTEQAHRKRVLDMSVIVQKFPNDAYSVFRDMHNRCKQYRDVVSLARRVGSTPDLADMQMWTMLVTSLISVGFPPTGIFQGAGAIGHLERMTHIMQHHGHDMWDERTQLFWWFGDCQYVALEAIKLMYLNLFLPDRWYDQYIRQLTIQTTDKWDDEIPAAWEWVHRTIGVPVPELPHV